MGLIQSTPGLKRMLLVGINYVGDKENALAGCHNDCLLYTSDAADDREV